MIEIPRDLLKIFCDALKHSIWSRQGDLKDQAPVTIVTTSQQLLLICTDTQITIRYEEPSTAPPDEMSFPSYVLDDYAGDSPNLVRFQRKADGVKVTWEDHERDWQISYPSAGARETLFPDLPSDWQEQPLELWDALDRASRVVGGRASPRGGMANIHLEGSGRVVGTDGRQLYLHRGFSFPWEGGRLIRPSKVFRWRPLRGFPLQVAAREEVFFKAGPWMITFGIEEQNYPDVDSILNGMDQRSSILQISEADATRLLDKVPQFPKPEEGERLRLLLHASASRVESSASDPKFGPMVGLRTSSYQGDPLRIECNPKYFLRALKWGFRHFTFGDEGGPIYSEDGDRAYLWMPFTQ